MDKERVRAYYAHFGEREWLRLVNPNDGAVEFAITCHMLSSYLPATGRVLDIGGGPGRYTIWLAERGYRVVLADLSPDLLEIARAKIAEAGVGERVEAIVEADACDLGAWADGSFDAVLSLGPFYHLPDATDRERAASELARVLCPDGLAFVALMSRYAFLRRTIAIPDERRHLAQAEWVARLLNEGVFENDVPGRFAHGYGARPEEIAPFFAQHGLSLITLLAAEGIVGDIQRVVVELAASDPATYGAVFDILVQTASDPSILGASTHLLYIGRKGEGV
jgi:SAM-dependent methyltransferase